MGLKKHFCLLLGGCLKSGFTVGFQNFQKVSLFFKNVFFVFYNSRIKGEYLASKINFSPQGALAAACSGEMLLFLSILCLLLLPLFVGVVLDPLLCSTLCHF